MAAEKAKSDLPELLKQGKINIIGETPLKVKNKRTRQNYSSDCTWNIPCIHSGS